MIPIRYVTGDATNPQGDGPKIIAHVVNDQGGWGAGFVLALSRKWREPEAAYRRWARDDNPRRPPFELGRVQFIPVGGGITVANMLAQHGYRVGTIPLCYEALRRCLGHVAAVATGTNASVHMPRIGCGLAGGTWAEVEPIVRDELAAKDVPVTVYDLPT